MQGAPLLTVGAPRALPADTKVTNDAKETISPEQLKAEFDAVLLTGGAEQSQKQAQPDQRCCGVGHDVAYDRACRRHLPFGQFEHQFVVHGEQHPHLRQAGRDKGRRHPDHGALDDVGTRPLDRRIDCCPFTALAFCLIRRLDAREVRLPAEQRLRKARIADMVERFGNVAVDAGETFEIAINQCLRFVRSGPHPAGQAPARNAIKDRKVDRLGASARVPIHFAEQFLGRQAVNIFAIGKGRFQRGHVGHIGGKAQFDLRIVGAEQNITLICDKGLADSSAGLGPHRNILKIGVVRRQPPGLRADQRVAGMDAPRFRVDLCLQGIGIG